MATVDPFANPSAYGTGKIGGVPIPGVIADITGFEKVDEWTFQKGTSGNNAVTVWKGTKLAEEGTITVALKGTAAWNAYEAFRNVLRPKLGTKPPSLNVENAKINGNGVLVIVCKNAPVAKWIKQGGYWSATMSFGEFNPPAPAKAGQAGAAKPTAATPPETAGEKQLSALLEEASKL